MRPMSLALAALIVTTGFARADCQAEIAVAMRRANALPETPGRAALLEQIQRADIARHEDDDGECHEQIDMATGVLDSIDAAKEREAKAAIRPEGTPGR